MCGRFVVLSEKEKIELKFKGKLPADYEKRFNLAPTQKAIVKKQTSDNFEWLNWGFSLTSLVINARIETIFEKPSFNKLLENNRCIIPSNGFYEWERSKFSQPYFLSLENKQLFGYAGFWQNYTHMNTTISQFVIMTLPAKGIITTIHDRLPAILPTHLENEWLNPNTDIKSLISTLKQSANVSLEMHPVSTKVNKIKYDNPELILPGDEQLRLF